MNKVKTYNHQTAITRGDNISAPLKKLIKFNLIKYSAKLLDYGCGRGDDITNMVHTGVAAWGRTYKYDPHWGPKVIPNYKYGIVLCTYVLNVITSRNSINKVLQNINSLLRVNGIAYITVRKISESTKTQHNVYLGLPVIYETNSYCIYMMTKKHIGEQGNYQGVKFPLSYINDVLDRNDKINAVTKTYKKISINKLSNNEFKINNDNIHINDIIMDKSEVVAQLSNTWILLPNTIECIANVKELNIYDIL